MPSELHPYRDIDVKIPDGFHWLISCPRRPFANFFDTALARQKPATGTAKFINFEGAGIRYRTCLFTLRQPGHEPLGGMHRIH